MEINERYIQISGKVPGDFELQNDDNVRLVIEGEVCKVEYPSQKDGTQDVVFKIKIADLYDLEVLGGENATTN